MNKQKVYKYLTADKVRNTENSNIFKRYLRAEDAISFFSWKLFSIKATTNSIFIDSRFNIQEADKYITRELQFISKLKNSEISFNFIKLIPDELPYYLWNINDPQATLKYANAVKQYFNKYIQTEVYLMTDFLKNPEYNSLYNKTFKQVQESFDKNFCSSFVLPSKFKKEIKIREKMYGYANGDPNAKKIAIKVFSLFAAENAVLNKVNKDKVINNLTLLGGIRSIDTYKYRLLNASQFPKLFVL